MRLSHLISIIAQILFQHCKTSSHLFSFFLSLLKVWFQNKRARYRKKMHKENKSSISTQLSPPSSIKPDLRSTPQQQAESFQTLSFNGSASDDSGYNSMLTDSVNISYQSPYPSYQYSHLSTPYMVLNHSQQPLHASSPTYSHFSPYAMFQHHHHQSSPLLNNLPRKTTSMRRNGLFRPYE